MHITIENYWETIITWIEDGDVNYIDIIDMINTWYN